MLKAKKEKLAARVANTKGYRDLVMSTEGISLNIVENATSDKLSKGDLRKAWGRLERRWNPKTREDKVEVYTKFLNYKLENTRQKPMDWLAFLEKKQTELANTIKRELSQYTIINDENYFETFKRNLLVTAKTNSCEEVL